MSWKRIPSGDWVVNLQSRVVAQLQGYVNRGSEALVIPCNSDKIQRWPAGACIGIAGRYDLDELKAWDIMDTLDTSDWERGLHQDYLYAIGETIPFQSKRSLVEQDLCHTLRELEVPA